MEKLFAVHAFFEAKFKYLILGLPTRNHEEPKILLVNKIAIECDGHDFHSSKEQIMKDNQRTRILTKNGWSVIRYSGSEIYQDSKNELKSILDEIIQIFKKNGM